MLGLLKRKVSQESHMLVLVDHTGRGYGLDHRELMKTTFREGLGSIIDKGVGTVEKHGNTVVVVYKQRNEILGLQQLYNILKKVRKYCEESNITELYVPLIIFSPEKLNLEMSKMLLHRVFSSSKIKVVY